MNNDNLIYKYVIVGNSCTGKSCLLYRYIDNRFESMHNITIGVEFGSRVIMSNGHTIKLQIWDTVGQEAFKSITSSYFRGSIGAILVFDITDKKSFDDIKEWMDIVKDKSNSPVTFILIGCKSDLESERVITRMEAFSFAKKYDMDYIEASSKTCQNVNLLFELLTNKITLKIRNGTIDNRFVCGAIWKYGSNLDSRLERTEKKEKVKNGCQCG
jgi:Ras-related protein Rab-2A